MATSTKSVFTKVNSFNGLAQTGVNSMKDILASNQAILEANKIANSASKVQSITEMIGTLSKISGVMGMAGAALGIATMFMQTPDQAIIQQLNEISSQISDLQQSTNLRFKQLKDGIKNDIVLQPLQDQIDVINGMLLPYNKFIESAHKYAVDKTEENGKDMVSNLTDISQLNVQSMFTAIATFEDHISEPGKSLSNENFLDTYYTAAMGSIPAMQHIELVIVTSINAIKSIYGLWKVLNELDIKEDSTYDDLIKRFGKVPNDAKGFEQFTQDNFGDAEAHTDSLFDEKIANITQSCATAVNKCIALAPINAANYFKNYVTLKKGQQLGTSSEVSDIKDFIGKEISKQLHDLYPPFSWFMLITSPTDNRYQKVKPQGLALVEPRVTIGKHDFNVVIAIASKKTSNTVQATIQDFPVLNDVFHSERLLRSHSKDDLENLVVEKFDKVNFATSIKPQVFAVVGAYGTYDNQYGTYVDGQKEGPSVFYLNDQWINFEMDNITGNLVPAPDSQQYTLKTVVFEVKST